MSTYDDPRWYEEHDQDANASSQPNEDASPSSPVIGSGDISLRQPSSQPLFNVLGGSRLVQVLVLLAVVIIAFSAGWFSHQIFSNSFALHQSDKSKYYAQMIQEAWTDIDQNYVDRKAVNYQTMAYKAIDAMVTSLNDTGHSRFQTAQDVQKESQQLSGTFIGIGINLRQDQTTKQIIISSAIAGSPAEQAGFLHDDIITAVNGVSTVGKDLNGLKSLIRGEVGTSVAITVQRPSTQQTLTITVKRAEIKVPNVIMHYIAEDHIAHIQIVQFADGVSSQLKDALHTAKSMGATKFILDLRGDPGGYLKEAVGTASEFLKTGNVLLEQDSTGQRTPVPVKTENTIDTTDSIVVLINENTASAAEIVSGALQDNHRAILIGQTTLGTGTVLDQFPLPDGSALLLGTQEWLTPNGHFIRTQPGNDGGIKPDITVALGTNEAPLVPNDENAGNMTVQQILSSKDTQLVAAINYLQTH